MFESKKKVSENRFANTLHKTLSRSLRLTLILLLLALFAQNPVFATDPIDVDPDPDHTTTIIVEASEASNATTGLPPGHYVIIVVAEDGSTVTFEIWI